MEFVFVSLTMLLPWFAGVAWMRRFWPQTAPGVWPAVLGYGYLVGSGLGLWATWQVSSLVGVLAGTAVPESWSLDFAVPLVFLALAVTSIRDRSDAAAAATAGAVAVTDYAPISLNPSLSTNGRLSGSSPSHRNPRLTILPPPREQAASRYFPYA